MSGRTRGRAVRRKGCACGRRNKRGRARSACFACWRKGGACGRPGCRAGGHPWRHAWGNPGDPGCAAVRASGGADEVRAAQRTGPWGRAAAEGPCLSSPWAEEVSARRHGAAQNACREPVTETLGSVPQCPNVQDVAPQPLGLTRMRADAEEACTARCGLHRV